MALAAYVLFPLLLVVVMLLLRGAQEQPTPIEGRRRKLTKRLNAARKERQRIEPNTSSGRVTNPILIDATQTNLGRAKRVIQECEHELEQLEVDETEGRLDEIESD